MRNLLRFIPYFCAVLFAAAVFGADIPSLDVTVSDTSGKMAYKGKTTSAGSFATPTLPAGEYNVQLISRSAMNKTYALVMASGKQKVVSQAVAGSKFSQGGVAMRIKVGQGLGITGQVTDGAGVKNLNAKTKVINGKNYVWMPPETGSNMGGRWVEEGSVMPSSVQKGKGGNGTQVSDGVSVGR
ncbi:MAG: hypothetical protein ABI883_04790 [Chthoniobacterales bacterium]